MVLTGVRADLKLAFCPTQFKNEHAAWKTVIQLNLIRCASVWMVLDQSLTFHALQVHQADPRRGANRAR
jgi:hypothetical protein